jgi:hypothetical protein
MGRLWVAGTTNVVRDGFLASGIATNSKLRQLELIAEFRTEPKDRPKGRRRPQRNRWFADPLLEEVGFEPPIPLLRRNETLGDAGSATWAKKRRVKAAKPASGPRAHTDVNGGRLAVSIPTAKGAGKPFPCTLLSVIPTATATATGASACSNAHNRGREHPNKCRRSGGGERRSCEPPSAESSRV